MATLGPSNAATKHKLLIHVDMMSALPGLFLVVGAAIVAETIRIRNRFEDNATVPSLRAKRSNPFLCWPRDGLLRRFAPRNDTGRHYRHANTGCSSSATRVFLPASTS